MAGASFATNPLLWVHFRLAGGLRNAITLGVGYALIAGVVAVFTFGGDLGVKPVIATAWLLVMSMLQSGILVLAGAGSIRRAIQQDFATGMMDSHRLTPISGPSAIFGYLIGPNIGPLLLLGMNTLFGLPLCAVSGYPVHEWLTGILVTLVFAGMVWCATAVVAMVTQGYGGVVALVGISTLMAGWLVVPIVPGLAALVFGVVAATFSMLPGSGGILSLDLLPITATILAQVVVAATCFWAAARKYRRPDRRAFSVWLAFALLAEFALVGGLGIAVWKARPQALRNIPSAHISTQIIATLTVLAVLAMLPISAMVQAHVAWQRRHRLEPGRPGRRPPFPLLGVLLAALFIVGAVAVFVEGAVVHRITLAAWRLTDGPGHLREWLLSFVVLAVGLMPPALLLRPSYRRNASGAVIVGLWFLLTWLLPPLLDLILNVSLAPTGDATVTWLTGISPIGALVLVWYRLPISLVPGLVVQGAPIAGLAAMIKHRRLSPRKQ